MDFLNQTSVDDIEEGKEFAPKFDENGLICCVVSDHTTKDVVMVAYMNAEALSQTITTRTGTYWSRSRNKLWVKGETSGHTQHVERMRVDCDQDVILMSVTTAGTGANCHTGRKSCFFRDIDLEVPGANPQLVTSDEHRHFDPAQVYTSE
ncbi:MAG: phosphoribosyl-AMP cyclohydrolase [Hyphomicrobiales bacterium]